MLAEPIELLKQAIAIANEAPEPVPMISRIFTRENAESHLRDNVR
jgi:hypothetical protein